MLLINETDYTVYLIVAISIVLLFAGQFLLCRFGKRRWIRELPAMYIVMVLILAFICAVTSDGSGFIDLSKTVALLLCSYAGMCAAAIGAAWGLYSLKRR